MWEWACARAGAGRAILATLDHGARVRVDLADPMCRFPLAYAGMGEPALTAALRATLQPGDTCLDVGANLGYYSLLACQRVGPPGQVFSFEPNPSVAATLRANLALNEFAQARVIESAVGRASGQTVMHIPVRGQSGLGTLSAETAAELGSAMREVPIAVTSLDDFLAATPLASIRAMKVDAEGFELEILAGARELLRRFHPLLFLEVGADTGPPAAVTLREQGYEVARLGPGGALVTCAPACAWTTETLCGVPVA